MYIYISYSQHLQHIGLLVQLTHSRRTEHATGQCAKCNVLLHFAYEDEYEV